MERRLKEVKLDSAKTFSELYGLKDQSPLIGVIDLALFRVSIDISCRASI